MNKKHCFLFLCFLALSAICPSRASEKPDANPMIDYTGFLQDASKVGRLRDERRISEDDFIRMASEPGTVIYDARTRDKYELLHITGAIHLSLTDVTEGELSRVIPDKKTRILIYCNNNFENEREAFQSKRARASLNIYTFNTLYSYGYRNVYELAPLLDINKTRLRFSGTRKEKSAEK